MTRRSRNDLPIQFGSECQVGDTAALSELALFAGARVQNNSRRRGKIQRLGTTVNGNSHQSITCPSDG